MSELLLGIDIGTSSSKDVLVRPDGEIVTTSERGHDLSLPHPAWAEHDAESIWWADFQSICADLLAQATAPVVALCVSSIGPCLLTLRHMSVDRGA